MIDWMPTVSDVRGMFLNAYADGSHRVGGTIELEGVSFVADEPAIFGEPNEYIDRELAWYLSMSRYVDDIPGSVPKIWRQVSSRHGRINSNYGWCVFSHENGDQVRNVIDAISKDNDTRQAVAIYTRPSMHSDAFDDGMHDFICTNTVTYHLRDGKVNAVVNMRSNDAVYGYKNDFAWQKFMLEYVVGALSDSGTRCSTGTMIWQAASLHIYERHWKYLSGDVG